MRLSMIMYIELYGRLIIVTIGTGTAECQDLTTLGILALRCEWPDAPRRRRRNMRSPRNTGRSARRRTPARAGREWRVRSPVPQVADERARRSARPPRNPVASGRHRMSD